MKEQLSTEAEADDQAFKKITCWCDSTEEEKREAIALADDKVSTLTTQVEQFSASDGELSASIAAMKDELAAKKAAAEKARALREKEHGMFNDAEVEMVQCVAMLRNAIQILQRHATGLLQITPALHESLGSALQWVALKQQEFQSMPESQLGNAYGTRGSQKAAAGEAPLFLQARAGSRSLLEALSSDFLQPSNAANAVPVDYASRVLQKAAQEASAGSSVSLAQQPAPFKSYNPRSEQIMGVLQQMLEEFENNLSESQKAELSARTSFADLKDSLEKQIEALAASLDEKQELHSSNAKSLLDAKQDLEATRATRAADVKYLSDVRLQCQDSQHEYSQRTKARQEELKAVADAISILTEDDARALFDKKMGGASFVQLASASREEQESRASARRSAARLLLRAAHGLGSDMAGRREQEHMASLAVRVRLDAFSKVKEAMDSMIADLKEQQEAEVKHKETCKSELNGNEKATYSTERELSEAQQKITALEETTAQLADDIAAAHKAIAAIKLQLKEAGESRKGENARFQEEVTDQRAVQHILAKAIARLRQVYKVGASLVQEPTPPTKFQPYAQSEAAGPVLSLLEQIVQDAAKVEKDEVEAEQAAQKAYEDVAVDVTASVKQLEAAIETKTKAKASATAETEETRAVESSLQSRLADLGEVAADLHTQCDFFLKNFEVRQTARQEEIEAIQKAKAFLSGMRVPDGSGPAES
eukprot:CAMPEP_0178440708 /NCGR_PEP_ID=MMETSP0689_2-20121128/36947_1 /TAXON_ID=160604 /ORGANISM="Amphidinium massartii, Strain CS-259" /LENGTH=711 /DNA_ID=CAMNT_0020063549 /DNA_START=247 /DNA_END=2382 /DNA_ORIENTATION=-